MKRLVGLIAILASVFSVCSGSVWAQETTETAASDVPVGTRYVRETHKDWIIQCLKTETGVNPCNMAQVVKGDVGNDLVELTLTPIQNETQIVAGMDILTPLGALLAPGLAIDVDGLAPRRFPYVVCTQEGCLVRAGLQQLDLDTFKSGNVANIQLFSAATPDKPVVGQLSLAGFTAAYDALTQ